MEVAVLQPQGERLLRPLGLLVHRPQDRRRRALPGGQAGVTFASTAGLSSAGGPRKPPTAEPFRWNEFPETERELVVTWVGPYAWPGFERDGLPALPNHGGVYLMTFEHEDGFLIYTPGEAGDFRKRFRRHGTMYRFGEYNVLDADQAQAGVRREVWHGWGWTPDKRVDYAHREAEFRPPPSASLPRCEYSSPTNCRSASGDASRGRSFAASMRTKRRCPTAECSPIGRLITKRRSPSSTSVTPS